MQSSEAFQLHLTLSANARQQTSFAVSLDEARDFAQAKIAYKRAADLLTSYIRSFGPQSPAFAKLAFHERSAVSQTWTKLSKHLHGVDGRRRALGVGPGKSVSTPQVSQPPQPDSKFPRNDPLVKMIEENILDHSAPVRWDDIYGLEDAKKALHEMVVLPAQRPDLYKGLRAPGRGILLFGPPGTGKTLIAKAVASNVNATFFSISASSLNSKYHGESEQLVRALFRVARERQPSFVFIDEVDSILGARSDSEHEASRRLKTEFMAQFDGAGGGPEDRVYVMAASNRPQDLDDAVRRRLDRRIYVPLPDANGRREFLKKLTSKNEDVQWALTDVDFEELARVTRSFSGSDMKALCREASLMPLRELGTRVSQVQASEVRACGVRDFVHALQIVRPSSSAEQVEQLESWDRDFGSQSRTQRMIGSTRPGSKAPQKSRSTRVSAVKARPTQKRKASTRSMTSSTGDFWGSFRPDSRSQK